MGRPKKAPIVVQSFCVKCGRMLDKDEFYKSVNPNHATGYTPYCKTCAYELCMKYLQEFGTMEAAIYLTCADLGFPFIKQTFDNLITQLEKGKSIKNYIGAYIRLLTTHTTKAEREKYIGFQASDSDFKEVKGIQKADQSIAAQKKQLEILWGAQYTSDQLAYLEYRFTAYTQDIEEMSEYQEITYRNLCKTDLQIYEQDDVESAIKRQMQLAKILKIDNFENTKDKSLAEKILEHEIYLIEENEPAEYFENKDMYKDFRGTKAGYIKELLRPLKNLLLGSKDYKVDEGDMSYFDEQLDLVNAQEGNKK